MLTGSAEKHLKKTFGNRVRFNEPMSRHTTIRIGGPADAVVYPEGIEELKALLKWADAENIPAGVFGDGTNLLVRDGGIRGIVILLSKGFRDISEPCEDGGFFMITAGAGARLAALCRAALKHSLKGLNYAVGIPGTIGGAVAMNAGTKTGETADVIDAVQVVFAGKEPEWIGRNDLNFSYRKLSWEETGEKPVIVQARFRLEKGDVNRLQSEADALISARKSSQPTTRPNAGCFFKNPANEKPAGLLIERAGLKGAESGGAMISEKHANFIVNTGNANASDVLDLMEKARREVKKRFNVQLETEVIITGEEA